MASYRFPGNGDGSRRDWAPLPFRDPPQPPDVLGQVPSTAEVLKAFEEVSRRMENLARSLGCLGYFDEDDDGPRAA